DFKFTLEGKRLHGSFVLVRMRNDLNGGNRTNWLLIKHHDDFSVENNGEAILEENDTSVASGRPVEPFPGLQRHLTIQHSHLDP
ncbi:hypothetical protein ACC674_38415, partial [Rhizobium ruizarguesonis]